ncbi:MAG: hypothetical protein IKM99_05360 [Bacteroidales bacterium]|nr:hypothetical protein [Bacteroidales bacterium]
MASVPAIDKFFKLEEALKEYGFKIDEKGSGACIAYDYRFGKYGEIWIEFNQAFISNYQTDMCVSYCKMEDYIPMRKTLFLGVAPTNQHDFETLMQLLFPSDAFIDRIEDNIQEREWIHANM